MVHPELWPPLSPPPCHVTAVLLRFATVAVKLAVPPRRTWLDPETVTEACEPPPPPEFVTLLVQLVRRTRMPNTGRRMLRRGGSRDSFKVDLRIAGSQFQKQRGGTWRVPVLTKCRRDSCAGLAFLFGN